MQRLRTSGLLLCGVITAAALTAATPAYAGGPLDSSGSSEQSGGRSGNTIYAKISFDTSKNGSGKSTGGLTVSNSDWSPPPCWFAPLWDPKQFADATEKGFQDTINYPGQHNYAKRAAAEYRDKYKDGEYKNYNMDKQGEGMWWGVVENPDEPDILKRLSCNDTLPFWVDKGDTPPVENAISPEILAGLAYQQLQVPDTDITLSPNGQQTVNLPTWAWLDSSTFKPVSVTASLDGGAGLNMSATTTATPVALKLEPGTANADLHPSSGECPINEDGSIGTPYVKGSGDKTPPCGMTYLRATQGGAPYSMKATITWKVDWTGSGGTGGDLPDGTFGTTQNLVVREVQAVNR
ncbi:hypothetical protein [Streptomyces sp. NPDC018031]|uniref:hypothetical protein n=1 Tax=Streptomyces sp. NPDC018031 TaxID=3365033 RepID=UPI0037A39935